MSMSNHRQSFMVGPRLFVPASGKPGLWLEWFISPYYPPTFSGFWVLDDFGFLVER